MTPNTSGARAPLWSFGLVPPAENRLGHHLEVDVCVLGGGIAGLTTAFYLLEEGHTVALLEDGSIGSGETGRTSAHLASALDDHYFALEGLHGADGARLAADSHAYAIDEIERISRENGIICDFRRVAGYLFRASEDDADRLDREFDAARRAGLAVSWADRAPFVNFDTKRCLVFANQAQFHPLRYLLGLADAVREKGGQIYTGTHASSVEGGSPAKVVTKHGPVVSARAVVVATNSPVIDRVSVHTKQAAYRTYLIGAAIGKGVVPHALYWDMGDPYHYIRVVEHPGNDESEILLIGGEDQKTGQEDAAAQPFENLEKWARLRFPSMGPVENRWSGQVLEPVDGLAFIGPDPEGAENVYIVTGDSGNGLTHATLGARLIADLIVDRPNEWARLYDPSRKPARSVREFLKENLNAFRQYTDWATSGEVDSADHIPPGKGAILRRGVKKVAAFKDAAGKVCEFSAKCPHLGAVVRWNNQEQTWDCPAHGSRFTCDGQVLNGPANVDLAPAAPDPSAKI